jgi:ubiquinone/menaquinone biosynthesis C-methylase UbiE
MIDDSRSYQPDRHRSGIDGAVERLNAQINLTWRSESALISKIELPSSPTIVEIGCGTGVVLERLRSLYPQARLIGVDTDERLLEFARVCHSGAELLHVDATATTLPSLSVDLVVMRYLLQHITDPSPVLHEAHRILKPGGSCMIFEVDGGLWGISQPHVPEIEQMQSKIWSAQFLRGGNRMIGRSLRRLSFAVGFERVSLDLYHYSSDEFPLSDFGPLLDPEQHIAEVEDGLIDMIELAKAGVAYRRWLSDPSSFVMLVGFAASATKKT